MERVDRCVKQAELTGGLDVQKGAWSPRAGVRMCKNAHIHP